MDLEECNQITDLTLAHLATGCPSLEKLVCWIVSCCTNDFWISFSHFVDVPSYYPLLSHQTLSHCELITDDGIRQLAAGSCAAESLSVLELDNCPLITDQTLEHLVSCHNLQRIELYDCQMITRAAIRRLRVGILAGQPKENQLNREALQHWGNNHDLQRDYRDFKIIVCLRACVRVYVCASDELRQ